MFRGLQRAGTDDGIGVEPLVAFPRHHSADVGQVLFRVNAQQLLIRDFGGLPVHEHVPEPRAHQAVVDGRQAPAGLRVIGSRVVPEAGTVADESGDR